MAVAPASPTRDLPTINTYAFPVYEVVTPDTKKSFLIRSMTVAQESILKESNVSAARAVSMINQTIWECAENKEAPFDSIAGFEKNLTLNDRNALLAGLIISTYGEEQDFSFPCPNCGKEIKVKANIPANIEFVPYPGEDNFLEKRTTIELPVSKWKAILKPITLADEKAFNLTRNVSQNTMRKMQDYMAIEKLFVPAHTDVEGGEGGSKKKKNIDLTYTNVMDIYSKFITLPARDRKELFKEWQDVFGSAKMDITIPAICSECNTENKFPVDPLGELFRQLRLA